MASYKMEIKDGIIYKTLAFMGHDFTEEWYEDDSICQQSIVEQIELIIPDLEESEKEITNELTCIDEDELLDAIYALTEYEKSIN